MAHCCPLAFQLPVIQLQWNSTVTPPTTHSTWCPHLQVAPLQTEEPGFLKLNSDPLETHGHEAETEREAPRDTEVATRRGQMLHTSILPLTKEIHSHRETARCKTENSTVVRLGLAKDQSREILVHSPRLAHRPLPMASQSKAGPCLRSLESSQRGQPGLPASLILDG